MHGHLTRLLSVSWLSTSQRERVERCIHIISLIADRRGLIHFLRSSHSSISDTSTRSRRTSRSATSDRRYSNETLLDENNLALDVEHKRVIDGFVVIMININLSIFRQSVLEFPFTSQLSTQSINSSGDECASRCDSWT